MVEIGKFVRVDLSCVIVIHLVSCSYIVSYAFLAYRSISQYPTHSKPPAFSSPERNPPIPAKISKYFISTNHLLSDFFNKKTAKSFSKLNRYIDIFISSSSVCSLSSLTIWKSSTPGITPSVLPLCAIFLLCRVRLHFFRENR